MIRRYSDLAGWFTLLTPPEEYGDEAVEAVRMLREHAARPVRDVLELGCGAGHLASHLKAHVALTLTDRSPEMLALSRARNPECAHAEADMRTLRLGRTFDAVLVHDAVMYLASEADLRAAIATAAAHLAPGGVALFLPDCVRETFAPDTQHGGSDAPDGRGMRFVEWTWDPDPTDEHFEHAVAYLLREPDGRVWAAHDHERYGLFSTDRWLGMMRDAGLAPRAERDPWRAVVLVGTRAPRPAGRGA
jgi:SAM-dependent methyltransferase